MTTVQERVVDFDTAVKGGWVFVGIFPRPNQPHDIHGRLMRKGHEVADCGFDGEGKLTKVGEYALWVYPLCHANCGCVFHAEDALACEHDTAVMKENVKLAGGDMHAFFNMIDAW
mgnify:FL=1